MRPIAVLVSVLTLIAAMAAVVWFGQPPVEVKNEQPKPRVAADKPQPREQGPHPKCVVVEATYDFGTMKHREKGSHVFKVKNEGTVPLKLQTGQTTCQCTIGKLGQDTVPPGGETTIELNWEIKARRPSFQHQATIHTDDPDKLQFELIVKGFVTVDLIHAPNDLTFGALTVERPSRGVVYVASMNLDDFKITQVEASSDDIKTSVSELAPEDRSDFYTTLTSLPDFPREQKLDVTKAVKKVYQIQTFVTGQKRQGSFKGSITIRTDIPNSEPISVPIAGENPGAFQFFPQGGARWSLRALTLDLGEFSGEMGRKRGLNVIGRESEEPLNFVVESVTPEFLKVTTTPNAANKRACMIEVEVPAGTPSLIRTTDEPATVVLKSTQSQAETVELKVIFSVQ